MRPETQEELANMIYEVQNWSDATLVAVQLWPHLITAPAQAAPQCRYPDGCSTLGGPCPTCYPDPLEDLVKRFSAALLAKLKLARENGRNGWEQPDWEDACQRGLLRHIEKGDPRDVAAYCAFMWHHGWITVAAQPPAAPVETVEAALRDAFPHFQDDAPITADAIRKLGNEWTEMVMGWSPVQREITFSDQDGNDRKLEWEVFENSAGWVIADSETWEVREPHPSPSAESTAELTSDFAQALPGGKMDDSTYAKIEDALDRINAPFTDASGKWLSLHERIAALRPMPDERQQSADTQAVKLANKIEETLAQGIEVTLGEKAWKLVCDSLRAQPQRSVASEHPISQGMLRTQEIMCAADMEAKIAALAHRFWSIHPSSIDDMGLTREEFYAREMKKLLIPVEPQAVSVRDEMIEHQARFLLDRLQEFDPGDFQAERDFHGHVAPAISRLKSALAVTRPNRGSGE